MFKNISNEKEPFSKGLVHFVLSHSYLVFLASVIVGVVFDIFIPLSFFNYPLYKYGGFVILMAGTAIIFWAQTTSNRFVKDIKKEKTINDFEHGPYRYTRTPTHFGLFIMTLGFSFVIDSLFSIIFLVVASLLGRFVFIKKQEKILESKYGEPYKDYKKKVGIWL